MVTGGQRNDGAMLATVLDEIVVPRIGKGRARSRQAVIADRAYTSGSHPTPVAAPQDHRRHPAETRRNRRPPAPRISRRQTPVFNEALYKKRNLVERSFALLKQWRALATRYDKLAITYRAAVVLSARITWARHLGDML